MPKLSTNNPGVVQSQLNAAANGVKVVLAPQDAIHIDGVLTTSAEITATLATYLAPFDELAAARTAYRKALQARRATQAKAREYVLSLKVGLTAFLGRKSPSLAHFDMATKQAAPQTAEKLLIAQAKRTLTKQLRGALTKKQKAALKSVGTPDVTLGLKGLQVGPGAATAAQSAALAAAGSVPAPQSSEPPSPTTKP